MCCVTEPQLDVPPESTLLKEAYKSSGVTAADLAAATGLSTASVHIAMNGIRYRNGAGKVTVPPDSTVVKLASVLHVRPEALRAHGRMRAAALLEEAMAEGAERKPESDKEAQAAASARTALAKQVLRAFSTEELRAELERREDTEHEQFQRETEAELLGELRAEQGQP